MIDEVMKAKVISVVAMTRYRTVLNLLLLLGIYTVKLSSIINHVSCQRYPFIILTYPEPSLLDMI